MGFFSFIKRLIFRKKATELPEIPEISAPERIERPNLPGFETFPSATATGFTEERTLQYLQLISTKLDLINLRLEDLNRRIAALERIAQER